MRRIALFGLVIFVATVAVAAASSGGLPNIGTPSMKTQPVYKGYYDHHIDTYLITDVSSKSQAKAMHVNYSAELKAVKGLPEQYFVRGRAAKGQLTIFGSEPGETDYNPLWKEVWVTWKKGVKPPQGRESGLNLSLKGRSGGLARRFSNSAAELLPSAPSGSQDDHPAPRSCSASPFRGICGDRHERRC